MDNNEQPLRHIWTAAQMRKALTDLVRAATRRKSDFTMHIPPQPDDADHVIGDLIREVLAYRDGRARLESVEQVLTRLVRYYDERTQTAHHLADLTASNPSMQLHHALDAYGWSSKASTVRKVAENLEITLAPAALAGVPAPDMLVGPIQESSEQHEQPPPA